MTNMARIILALSISVAAGACGHLVGCFFGPLTAMLALPLWMMAGTAIRWRLDRPRRVVLDARTR